jgi:Spy/CpxP family protein refolding chaperone
MTEHGTVELGIDHGKKEGVMRKGMIGIAALLLLLVLSPAAPAFDQPCMMNDDMMTWGGMGMGCNMGMMGHGAGMMGPGMEMMGYGMLDLTPEQNTKINKILDDLRHKHFDILGKMMDEKAKMRDLFDEEKLDGKKIGMVQDALSALRKQLLESRVDATNRVREILTKEQRDQLKQMMRGRGYGCGSGMGPGMGGGQMRRGMGMMGQ